MAVSVPIGSVALIPSPRNLVACTQGQISCSAVVTGMHVIGIRCPSGASSVCSGTAFELRCFPLVFAWTMPQGCLCLAVSLMVSAGPGICLVSMDTCVIWSMTDHYCHRTCSTWEGTAWTTSLPAVTPGRQISMSSWTFWKIHFILCISSNIKHYLYLFCSHVNLYIFIYAASWSAFYRLPGLNSSCLSTLDYLFCFESPMISITSE